MFRFSLSLSLSLLLTVESAFAANAAPVVNTFTVATSSISPVPITAFTASDSDGTVVAYLVTETSTKPSATNPAWAPSPWTQYATTKIGALTLYAWAKDNLGAISSGKSAATNIVGNHNHDVYQKKYANVIVVAKSGGDFTDPAAAVNSITNASATNPYLVKIMPGVYNIGSEISIRMKPFVDIEGAGENVTVISGETISEYGFLQGASNAEVRMLSIINTASIARTLVNSGTSPKISNVTIIATGDSDSYAIDNRSAMPVLTNVTAIASSSGGTNISIRNQTLSPVMCNVKASVSGGDYNYAVVVVDIQSAEINNLVASATGGIWSIGVYFAGSNATLNNVTATSNGASDMNAGIYNTGSTIRLNHSLVKGSTWSVLNDFVLYVGNTMLDGAINNVGTTKCVGVFDAEYNPVACQ